MAIGDTNRHRNFLNGQSNMSKNRWDSYVLISNNEINNFWQEHFNNTANRSVLFIIGKGFDIRMNNVFKTLLGSTKDVIIQCLLIEYNEGQTSPSNKYQDLIKQNTLELEGLILTKDNIKLNSLFIDIWKNEGRDKRKIGDREISKHIYNYDISTYTDIIVDISSLPRGIYFSLIGTILKKIDSLEEYKSKNLFVTVAENFEIDKRINEDGIDEKIKCIHGFGGNIEKESNKKPIIFFPVLGEKKTNDLNRLYTHIIPEEICPILPFPSKNPRRSDSLIIEYHKILFDELRVESQNIMYVPEQNPFEMYRILLSTIKNYNKSLNVLNGCNSAVSVFSSKLLTIGVLLAAYEVGDGLGVYNLDAQGYSIENDDIEKLRELNKDSQIFLMWLNGEAYE